MLLDGMHIVALCANVMPSFAFGAVRCFTTSTIAVECEANGFTRRVGSCATQFEYVMGNAHFAFGSLLAALVLDPGFLHR